MELSEAKEILQNVIADEVIGTYCLEIQKTVNCEENCKNSDCYLYQAIDTILKALEKYEKQLDLDYVDKNYISKDEIRKKIEQLEFLRDDAIEDNFLGDARNLKERIDVLQELLGE